MCVCVCVCVYTNIPNRQIFKGISCGKICLVTRVGVAVCSIRGLHIHFFSLSQMQMYVKKFEYTNVFKQKRFFKSIFDKMRPFILSSFQLNKTTKKSRIKFLLYIYNKLFFHMFYPLLKTTERMKG